MIVFSVSAFGMVRKTNHTEERGSSLWGEDNEDPEGKWAGSTICFCVLEKAAHSLISRANLTLHFENTYMVY